ncbi:hypothetical protein BDV11DRAFT_68536 [Aspergillus similis]
MIISLWFSSLPLMSHNDVAWICMAFLGRGLGACLVKRNGVFEINQIIFSFPQLQQRIPSAVTSYMRYPVFQLLALILSASQAGVSQFLE